MPVFFSSVSTKNIFLVRPVFLNESRGRILFSSETRTAFWKEAPHWHFGKTPPDEQRCHITCTAIIHLRPDNKTSNLCLTRPPPALDALIQELNLHQLQGRHAKAEPDLWPSIEWASWKRISPTWGEFSHVNSWNGGPHRPHGSECPHYTPLALYQQRDYWADWSSNEKIHQNTGQTPASSFHCALISNFLTGICGNKLSLLLSLPFFFLLNCILGNQFRQRSIWQPVDETQQATDLDSTPIWQLKTFPKLKPKHQNFTLCGEGSENPTFLKCIFSKRAFICISFLCRCLLKADFSETVGLT